MARKKASFSNPNLLIAIAAGALAIGVIVALLIRNDVADLPIINNIGKVSDNNVTLILDENCGTCADITQNPEVQAVVAGLPEDVVRTLDMTSPTAQQFVVKHEIVAVPAMFIGGAALKKHADNEAIAALLPDNFDADLVPRDGAFEVFTTGNKRIINPSRIPQAADQPLTVFQFISPFCVSCVDFIENEYPKLQEQYEGAIAINTVVTPAGGDPALFAAEGATCAYHNVLGDDPENADQDAAFAAYTDALRSLQENQDTYYEAVTAALEIEEVEEREVVMRTALVEILGDDVATCLEEREHVGEVVGQMQFASELGFTGAPAYFVGDRFMAGPQNAESISIAIDLFIAEIAAIQQYLESQEGNGAQVGEDATPTENTPIDPTTLDRPTDAVEPSAPAA